jgi:putative PEP-CTERM system TPR-repeat lipoprotein
MRKLVHSIFTSVTVVLLAAVSSSCSPHARMARHLERADQYFESGQYDQAEIEYINALQIEPQNPQATGRLAVIYFDQGRLGQVMPRLFRGLQLQPDNLELRLKLGLMYLTIGKFKEARDEANFILDHKPQDAEAPLLLANAALKPNEIEEVRQQLQKLPQSAAESAPVLVALGTLDFRQHNFEKAEAAFQRALSLDPKSSAANEQMGILCWLRHDLPQADQAFAAAAELSPARSSKRLEYAQFKIQTGDLAAGKRLLEEMTQKTPDYLPAWMLLAQIAASEKKYDESAALNAKVLARDPIHPEALLLKSRLELEKGETSKAVAELESMLKIYPQSPQVLYQLGLAYLANGETEKAIASLKQAITLAPDFADAVILLAGIHIRMGEPNAAIVSLQQLVQRHPEISRAWLLLADAYRSADDFDNALAVYRQLERLFPRDPQVSWLMGLLFVQHKNADEAREAFNKALELVPDYLPALEQLVNLDLAEKQYPAALQRVQNLLEKNSNLPGLHLLLAKIFLAQNDTKQAEASLLKAIALQPDSSAAYFMLAELYANSAQHQKALANLQDVLAKNPKDVQALMLMGVIYDQQKNHAAARETYEKLLAINPNFSPAINNLAYLYSEQFGLLDKAYELAQSAWEQLPHEPHMEDTLGWILFKKHQYPRALSLLEESAGRLPAAAEVQFHLGMTHYMMGEEEPARLALQRALILSHDFPGVDEAKQRLTLLAIDAKTTGADDRAILEKAVADRPDDPVALARLADIYEREGTPAKETKIYQAALQVNPANLSALMSLVRLYSMQQDKAKAFELAKNAHQLAPDDPDVTRALGRLAYETGDYQWALSLLQETAGKKPDDPEVLYDLAEAFYSVGRVDDASTAMRHALQADASFSRAEKAKEFLEMTTLSANPQQAVATAPKVEQALKSDPADVPALMAMAIINEQSTDVRAAEQNYEKILDHYPDFAPAERRLAVLYAETPGDAPKAFDLASKARDAYPDDKEVAKALGIIVYRKGDYGRAANLLQESASERNSDAELMYYLGMAQYQLKHATESKQALQLALDLKLNPDLAADARRILAELK